MIKIRIGGGEMNEIRVGGFFCPSCRLVDKVGFFFFIIIIALHDIYDELRDGAERGGMVSGFKL